MIQTLWTLLVLVNTTGFLSSDIRALQFPMSTKEACVSAGKSILKESSGVSVTCIGSEIGEIVRIKNEK